MSYHLQQSLISRVRRNFYDFQLELISLEELWTNGVVTWEDWMARKRSLLHRLGAYWGAPGVGYEWAVYYQAEMGKKNATAHLQMVAMMQEFDEMFDEMVKRCLAVRC